MKEGQPIPNNEGKTDFELAIEEQIGGSIESIREMPIDKQRKLAEAKRESSMEVVSHWPFIGRREPLSTLSRGKVNKIVDDALR